MVRDVLEENGGECNCKSRGFFPCRFLKSYCNCSFMKLFEEMSTAQIAGQVKKFQNSVVFSMRVYSVSQSKGLKQGFTKNRYQSICLLPFKISLNTKYVYV
jgi:hypothetical protein